jgi:ribosomal protein S18 acetylase RimI-like enzyme
MKNKYIYQTSVDEACSHEDVKFLKNALSDYNSMFLGSKTHHFVIMVKDTDQVIAGAFVWMQNTTMYLDTIFVAEKYRKDKIGKTLLDLSEKRGHALGCNLCIIDTLGFQAQGFYEKFGYKVFANVPDYQGGYDRIYLKKSLL